MASRSNKSNVVLNPFVFALKEGKDIKRDFLDYSLMMLQVTAPEVIRSPIATKLFFSQLAQSLASKRPKC